MMRIRDRWLLLLNMLGGECDRPCDCECHAAVKDASSADPERKAYADYLAGRITRAEWSAVAFDRAFGPEPKPADSETGGSE